MMVQIMEGKIMTDKMKKLNDEAIENVTGGARRNDSND